MIYIIYIYDQWCDVWHICKYSLIILFCIFQIHALAMINKNRENHFIFTLCLLATWSEINKCLRVTGLIIFQYIFDNCYWCINVVIDRSFRNYAVSTTSACAECGSKQEHIHVPTNSALMRILFNFELSENVDEWKCWF